MTKIKQYVSVSIFCLTVFIFFVAFLMQSIKAETTSTTFPVDEAGIAAYVKLDSVDNIDITALAEAFDSIEKQGESYVVGTIQVENEGARAVNIPKWADYPHVYIGLDGWVVAYYLKGQETARIMQWKGYKPGILNTTILQDVIDIMCEKTGVTYSTPIKYYDFEFPDANKMTLIAETWGQHSGCNAYLTNNFYLTIPGVLYEASYSVYKNGAVGEVSLTVDGTDIFRGEPCSNENHCYGYYDTTLLQVNVTHYITFNQESWKASWGGCDNAGCSTVLIYKN